MKRVNAVTCASCTRLVPTLQGQNGPFYVDHANSTARDECVNSGANLGPAKQRQIRRIPVREVED